MNTKLILILFFLGVSNLLFSQKFYDIDNINTIKITFQESNWDALLDSYAANDEDQKLMGSIEINGVALDSIGVKYKGNSTYSSRNAKNPLHIYLDYVKNQDYKGYESIKLSNGLKDPSFVREVLSYEIARKYMDAPKSNYAKVYINNSYYGMFSSSEAINSDYTENRLDSDGDNTRIKCNPINTSSGNGPSLEYLGNDSSSYYNYYELKSDAGWQDLIDLTYALVNSTERIEETLDIDRAIWMLAFNNVVVNLDSYTGPFRQNYYLIKDDNNRFIPILWDLNESFGSFSTLNSGSSDGGRPGGTSTVLSDVDLFLRKDNTTYPLLKMIFDNERYTKMYVAHCKTMLNENFVSGWYEARADTLQDLIATDLAADPNAFYTSSQFRGNVNSTQDRIIGITQLMKDRITYLQKQTAFTYTQPTISNIVVPTDVEPFTTITVTASISNTNYAYLGYRHSKDEIFTKLEMFDDGTHNDGTASDGVYGVSFDVDESNTHYYIYAENSDAGIFSPEQAEHEYYKISAKANEEFSDAIAINEVMATNDTTMMDELGEYDDWVELYNTTNQDISLLGYYLTDDNDDIMQWAFPDTVIKANDYLIVWTDNDEEQGALHTNFKLSSDGDKVYLVNSELTIVNTCKFDDQLTDYGYARNPNATGEFLIQGSTFAFNNEETSIPSDKVVYITVGINNQVLDGITIYPTIVTNKLMVNIENESFKDVKLSIINTMGQTMISESIFNQRQADVDVSTLNSGLYFVVVESVNQRFTSRIVKQ